jgi:hypothetical protein
MRRILATSSIGNQPHNLHGKYVPGAGVGATSISTRRLKLYKSCIPQPIIVYIKVSNIATYDTNNNYWILNQSTVITPLQNLIIDEGQTLNIPFGKTLTNAGHIDNYGVFFLTNDEYLYTELPRPPIVGSTFYNTGKFNNYYEVNVMTDCKVYIYSGGSFYNGGSIYSNGLFAIPSINGSTCGTGFFNGNAMGTGGIEFECPL